MRSLRDIKKSIRHARIEAKPQADRAVLRHLLTEFGAAAGGTSACSQRRDWKTVAKSRVMKTAAAAIIAILALLVAYRPRQATPPLAQDRALSAADLLTVGCLNAACRRGGLEALEQQCEEAARRLDSRSERVSAREWMRELSGIQASKG